MKRLISTGLLLSLITLGLPAKTYAATDGCPQNWVIDTSLYPNSELESAKVALGRNIVVSELTEYSPKDNSWVKMPFYNARHFPWINQVPQRVILKVEVKDCPARSFTFPIQTTSVSPFTDISATEWAGKNPSRFRNFKEAEEWVASISTYKEFIIKTSQRFNRKNSNSFEKINVSPQFPPPGYRLVIFNQECGTDLLTPSVFRLKQGTNCKLGIVTGNEVFERFEIQNGNLTTSIVCIKGKTRKTINSINPKCPKGYKKAI